MMMLEPAQDEEEEFLQNANNSKCSSLIGYNTFSLYWLQNHQKLYQQS
jgi:hypothetical protein